MFFLLVVSKCWHNSNLKLLEIFSHDYESVNAQNRPKMLKGSQNNADKYDKNVLKSPQKRHFQGTLVNDELT